MLSSFHGCCVGREIFLYQVDELTEGKEKPTGGRHTDTVRRRAGEGAQMWKDRSDRDTKEIV